MKEIISLQSEAQFGTTKNVTNCSGEVKVGFGIKNPKK
jgi:hypothetical protein